MEWLLQLQNAVNYMEKHLLEKINYENAAKSVFMSSYNFHRTFSLWQGLQQMSTYGTDGFLLQHRSCRKQIFL